MTSRVSRKSQVVIAKEFRDRLGVEPGWLALQRLVGDHVEVHFLPPEHNESLKGSLAPSTNVRVPPGPAWRAAKERAWAEAARHP